MVYEQYVNDVISIVEQHTKDMSAKDLKEAHSTIEDAPAFTGKVWIEDILYQIY